MRRDRAGILLYFYEGKNVYFVLGADQTKFFRGKKTELKERLETYEIADFGGGVEKGEYYDETASRELAEETENIFEIGSDEIYYDSKSFLGKSPFGDMKTYIMEIPFHYSTIIFNKDRKEFRKIIEKDIMKKEMLDFVLLTKEELINKITEKQYNDQHPLWPKLKKFLNTYEIINYIESL